MDADRAAPAPPATPPQHAQGMAQLLENLIGSAPKSQAPAPKPASGGGLISSAYAGDDVVHNDFVAARSNVASADPWRALDAITGEPAAVGPAVTEGAAGAASKQPVEDQAAPPQPLGWRILDGVKAVGKDVALGVAGAPKHVVGGLLDAVNNMNDLIADATAKVPGPYLQVFNAQGEFEPKVMSQGEGRAQQLADRKLRAEGKAQGLTYNMEHPDTVTGDIIRTAVSFLAARKALAGSPTSTMGNIGADVAGTAGLSADQPRLSNVIDSVAPNFLTSFLKAKPEDEGTLTGHLKSGLEMAGLGQVFSKVMSGVKALKTALTDEPGLAEKVLTPGGPEAAVDGAPNVAAGEAAVAGTAPKTGMGAISEMADDIPWKTVPSAAAPAVDEAAAAAGAKGAGGIAAAPDDAAKSFLALGDATKPVVEPAFQPDVAAHAGAAEDFLAAEKGEAHPPVSIDGYLKGEGANPIKVNLARIGSADDIKDALARVSATIPKQETVSNASTAAAADALGLSPQEFLQGYKGTNLNAAETTAMRYMLDSSASQLVDYAKAASGSTATPEAKALFMKAFATHRSLQQYFENARAEAGRTLQAWSMVSQQSSGASKVIQNIIEGAGPDADTVAARIADLSDPVEVSRLVAASMKDTGRDNFMKYFYNVLLSNPRTIVKKLSSDTLMGMWNIATRYAAETFGSSIPHGETAELAYGYSAAFKDAIRAAGEGLRKGESQFFQQYQSMDALHSKRLNVMADGSPEAFANDQPTRGAMEYLRSALPTSWIGAADDFAKVMNYRAELRSLAFRKAAGSEDPETAMAQTMDNVPLALHKQAVAAALKNTFQEPLGAVGQKIQDLRDSLNLPLPYTKFELPLGGILMPFVKVPLNIAKWSYTNSPLPLAFPSSAMRQELAAGGATRDLAISKIGMGTGLSMGLSALALNGSITGRGPSDPQLQRAWRAAGNEPYSIKIGDKSYSYNMLEPMGLMAGAIADTFTIMKFAKEEDRGDLAASMVFGAGNAMLSKTYLQGVAEFFKTLEEPDQHSAGYADRLLASFVTPAGVTGLARAIDPFQRAHYDLLQTVESRLPYISQGLPPQRTLWGDPIPVKDGFMPFMTGTAAANLLSPVTVKDDAAEPIDKWIFENRMAFPRGPDNKLGLTKPGIVQSFSAGRGISAQVELTPEQHDRLQVLAGNELKDPATGLGAKDTLNGLVDGRGPAALQRQWDNAPPAARALIVQSVVNKFRMAAKDQLVREYPDVEDALRAGFQTRADALQPH